VYSCFFGGGIGSLVDEEASVTWHSTEHNTVVPVMEVRQLAENLSFEKVVRRVRKDSLWHQGNPSISKMTPA
jgi:hypothetical protein